MRDPAEVRLQPLAADPRYQEAAAELAALERRLEEAEKRERVARARLQGAQPTRSKLDRARDLVAGGTVIASTPPAELEAAEEEQHILRAAIAAHRDKLQQLASELSHAACTQFAALNAEALRAALEAATALHHALEAARVIRARLIAGGYSLNEAALPLNYFPAAAVLGDPDRVGLTPAALFKQWLRDKGILK